MSPAGTHPDARAWTYDELLREALSRIPAHAPSWTNHNASDPGITLVELLAYYTEVLAYRALRITPDARLNFLRLLKGPAWDGWQALIGQPVKRLDEALQQALAGLAVPGCLASLADFEQAALQACHEALAAPTPVRVAAVAGADLRRPHPPRDEDEAASMAGDISVVLAPEADLPPQALKDLCATVQERLQPRCQLTTRVHVMAPVVLHAFVSCRIALQEGERLPMVVARIDQALQDVYGPRTADDDAPPGPLHPLGQKLYISDLIEAVASVEGVDWIDQFQIRRLRLGEGSGQALDGPVGLRIGQVATIATDTRLGGEASAQALRLVRDEAGEVISLQLQPWEIVRVQLAQEAVTAVPWQERRR